MANQGNVHDNNVTEAQAALLKAVTPHILAMSREERQQLIIGNPNLPTLSGVWLKNGCRLTIKGPSSLVIECSKPFDPVKFIGKGWSVVEQDERALKLTEVDFAKVRFESGLVDNETVITGEEKLKRLLALPEIRLDAKIGHTLYEEKNQMTLRWLHETYGVTCFELAGTVLRSSDGDRYFLCLLRDGGGSWIWDCRWLDHARYQGPVSPFLAS